MSRPTLILVGGGGHCRSVIDVIEAECKWSIAGVLDREELAGQKVLDHPIIGGDAMIPALADQGHSFLVTAGQVKDAGLRIRLHQAVISAGGSLATVVSPLARVAGGATIGAGTVVCHFALVNNGAHVGAGCIVNTGALVEHDAAIGDHCHIATGAIVNGGCTVGARSFVGSGAVLLQAIRLGADCLVGAGAVVLKDVKDRTTVVGQPARER
ncbi:MAG: acetyltransferase [Flavobacteriales bacterium]